MMQEPEWVTEVKKEIKRLNRKIDVMNRAIKREEVDGIDSLEDISNWTGWRDGLSWCLKMREGKTTRKEAWGNKE